MGRDPRFMLISNREEGLVDVVPLVFLNAYHRVCMNLARKCMGISNKNRHDIISLLEHAMLQS